MYRQIYDIIFSCEYDYEIILWGEHMSKAKNEKQIEEKNTDKKAEGKGKTKRGRKKAKKLNISQILSGIGLLAIAVYTGLIVVQAPSAAGMEFSQYNIILREQMGIIGSMTYLLMQSLFGNGVLLFPVIFAAAGIAMIMDRMPTGMQKTGIVLGVLVILALLHINVTYISVKDNLMLGLMGTGGGVIGAAVAMLLLSCVGKAGAYIALVCAALIAAILTCHALLTKHGGEMVQGIKQWLIRCKNAIVGFIFVEVEEVEEKAPKASRKNVAKDAKQQEVIEVEGTSPERKRLTSGKETKQAAVVTGQQGVMTNLKEIHKTLGAQTQSADWNMAMEDSVIADSVTAQDEPESNVIDFRTRFEQLSMQEENEPGQRSFITIEQEDVDEEPAEETALTDTAETKPEQRRKKKVYAEELPEFVPVEVEEENVYQYPPIELLDPNPNGMGRKNTAELQSNVERLEKTLNDFGVKGKLPT